jgi:hypothetical protein
MRDDFQAFMYTVLRGLPVDEDVHDILNNYCVYKRNDE